MLHPYHHLMVYFLKTTLYLPPMLSSLVGHFSLRGLCAICLCISFSQQSFWYSLLWYNFQVKCSLLKEMRLPLIWVSLPFGHVAENLDSALAILVMVVYVWMSQNNKSMSQGLAFSFFQVLRQVKKIFLINNSGKSYIVMCCLKTGIRSEKCVLR